MFEVKQPLRIAVVGDVHDQWEAADATALERLAVDLVLLVGDFGNESVAVVKAIAALPIPKAVILGNHDCWYTASAWGQKQCPYDRQQEDRVQEQLTLLGETHVGYNKLEFPQWDLTVVGGRPFSWGGSEWKNAPFYRDRYGIENFTQSTARIVEAAQHAEGKNLIFMGHCGPTGLGEAAEDPCGRDWNPIGGDHGDPDLAEAIAQIQAQGKNIALVVFGHMHHRLRHRQDRLRRSLVVSPPGTVYLNAARVPRILENGQRNFSLVTLEAGNVTQASLVWLDHQHQILSEELLYNQGQMTRQSA